MMEYTGWQMLLGFAGLSAAIVHVMQWAFWGDVQAHLDTRRLHNAVTYDDVWYINLIKYSIIVSIVCLYTPCYVLFIGMAHAVEVVIIPSVLAIVLCVMMSGLWIAYWSHRYQTRCTV